MGSRPLFPCSSSTSQTLLLSQGRKREEVAGELAPAPGYTEEISLSLCLSACEPPPGPAPIPGLAPLFFPSQLHISHIPFPGPQAVPPRHWQGLCPLPMLLYLLCPSSCPFYISSVSSFTSLLLATESSSWGVGKYIAISCPFGLKNWACTVLVSPDPSAFDTDSPLAGFPTQKTSA